MKYTKSIALITCLVSLPLLTGCPSDNNNSNNNTPPAQGNAPSSLSGKTLSVSVSGGAAPFSSSGSYVFTPSGNGTSGTYSLQGSGGVQSNIGTYTYSTTGSNTANLVETEQSGTIVNNTLVFQSNSTGTISSSSSNVGGNQSGGFTLN